MTQQRSSQHDSRGYAISPVAVENAPTRGYLACLADWLEKGVIAPEIDWILALSAGAQAHRRLEAPWLMSKFVLDHRA